MSVYPITDKQVIAPLFSGWQETLIWSCLQDCMGVAFADHPFFPKAGQIITADFCFFAGTPNPELVKNRPAGQNFFILVPQCQSWADLIETCYGEKALKITRYATKKEPRIFDCKRLKQLAASIPASFSLKKIDYTLYHQILGQKWSRDLCAQFQDYDDFCTRGLGFCAVRDGIAISGASSYTVYREGIEIEIDTREDCRRQGFALACGARLILACLEKGLYPSWDAHNLGSLALAEKLGYHLDTPYTAYQVFSPEH